MAYANFIEALGIRFTEVGKDRVVAEMVAGPEHTNGADVVHGGVYMAFADTLGARGTIMNLPEATRTSTLESKTNFLRGGPPGKLIGVSTPVHVGRTTQVWQTVVSDEKGRKLAVVTQTQIVLPAGEDAARRQQTIKAEAAKD